MAATRSGRCACVEMVNAEFIVTQMELAGYVKKTRWGHYMLTSAGAEAA